MPKRLVVMLTLALLLAPLQPAVAQTGPRWLALQHGGQPRTAYLYVPESYDGTTPVPLLVALHPRSSSGRTLALLTGLDAAAEEQGFIAVFPDALESGWGEDATDPALPDDVGFLAALVDAVSADYAIDPDRVVLTGLGNGGLMAYRLLCEAPERFTAAAVVGPLLWGYHRDGCPEEAAAPVDLLIVHGDADPFYPGVTHVYTPLGTMDAYEILGAAETLAFWAARNDCPADAETPAEHVQMYADCADGTTTTLYRIAGGKQIWPRAGEYTLNRFGIDMTAIVTDFLLGESGAWLETAPARPEAEARSYVAYVPSGYDPAIPTPLVILLHGRWGSGAGTAAYTHFNAVAEAAGFIAAYPDGLVNDRPAAFYDTGWNYNRGNPFLPDFPGPDDAAFLAALIDDLALDLAIDRTRIYVAGMSNGAFMVNYLACHDPARYAGFASVAGSGYLGMAESCQAETPAPMVIIHGTADDNIQWNGNVTTLGGQEVNVTYPLAEVLTFWAAHNGCSLEGVDTSDIIPLDAAAPTRVRLLQAQDCPADGPVAFYGVIGGGHNWPGVEGYGPGAGLVNMDINAGEVIWEFFAGLSR